MCLVMLMILYKKKTLQNYQEYFINIKIEFFSFYIQHAQFTADIAFVENLNIKNTPNQEKIGKKLLLILKTIPKLMKLFLVEVIP